MSRLKYAIDSSHTKPWVERIGKIIVNFSAIELECIHWLVQFTEDHTSLKLFAGTPFAARVTELLRHVEYRSANPRWRKRAVRAWNDALQLAKVRNRVAHNPIVFSWRTSLEQGEPDFIGVPSLRGDSAAGKDALLSKAAADKATNEMATLAQKLHELRVEWCSLRDAGAVRPARPYRAKRVTLRRRLSGLVPSAFRKLWAE